MGEATLKLKRLNHHKNYEGCQAVGLEAHHSVGISEGLNNFWAAGGCVTALNTTPTLPYQASERQGGPSAPQGPDKLSCNSLWPFQLCSPQWWDVV